MGDLFEGLDLSEKEREIWKGDLGFACDEAIEATVVKAALRPADRKRVVAVLRLSDGLTQKAKALPVLLDALDELAELSGVAYAPRRSAPAVKGDEGTTYGPGEAREHVERAIADVVAKSGASRADASVAVMAELRAKPALDAAYRLDITLGRVAEAQGVVG